MSVNVQHPFHHIQQWEKETPDRLWLTQPLGNGQVKTWTFAEAMKEARQMAAHLKSLDYPPGSHIALWSKNTAWWFMADISIWLAGHVTIPLYPILTATSIRQILDHSEARLIFVGKLDGYDKMKEGVAGDTPKIAMPLAPATGFEAWEELIKKQEPLAGVVERSDDEIATIIYTSGTTGMPKGVMHSFGTLRASVAKLEEIYGTTAEDRMLSYLPLAHVFERWVVECGSMVCGNQVFFAESLETFVEDVKRAHPTIFISVPRLWKKFYAGVSAKMPPKKLARLLMIPIVGGVVKKKILTGLGLDAVRFAGSGSAPIPSELLDWYQALGLDLLEGYGMTENFCYSHSGRPGKARAGFVGVPQPGVECKLSDEGEILVKSPATMVGYYKNDDATKETMTDDGFLKTGDRGEIDGDGRLRITGRTKELFKTSKGKYVAPAPIENKLLNNDMIEQSCVTGSGREAAFALVVLTAEARNGDRGVTGKALEAHLQAVNNAIDKHERLAFLAVIDKEWTPESGLLTPTLKLKRGSIDDTYAGNLDAWYDEKAPVVWEAGA